MPSTVQLFSQALFKQNLRRFWPLLAAYISVVIIVGFAFMTDLNYEKEITAEIFMNRVFHLSPLLTLVIALFSIAIAVAVYSYMHNSTAAAMVNTLPYKRKTIYISNYFSGLFMLLTPLLILFIALTVMGWGHNCLNAAGLFKWLFIYFSYTILLYSLAAVMGMLTGHIIAHIAFFGIANFLLLGLQGLIDLFLSSFLYGYIGIDHFTTGFAVKATPVLYAYRAAGAIGVSLSLWLAYLLAGVFLAWSGLKLYEKRKMENAGDVIAIRKLNPLFKYGVTLCSSLAFGFIVIEMFNVRDNFLWSVILLLLAGGVGYFVAEMLLKKSYRVLSTYKGFVVYTLILIIVAVSVYNDWYGYAARLPDIAKVEAIAFSHDGLSFNAVNNLQAEKGLVYINVIPNVPDSLALTYGTPVDRVEEYSGGYRYVYKDAVNLSPEETRLFLSMIPGIYTQDESIAEIYELHAYLSQHIKEVRNIYRTRNTSRWYDIQEHPVSHYDIQFIYKLDNGKTETYKLPVLLPKEIVGGTDKEIFYKLTSIAGSAERRDKKVAAIDIKPDNIRYIYVDQSIMQKYTDVSSKVDRPLSATREISGEIKINSEDHAGFINALKADYLSMSNEEMLKLNYENWGYASIAIDNLDLPPDNGYKDRNFGLEIDFNHKNCLEFLYSKGYIDRDTYDFIREYSKLAAIPESITNRIAIAAR